VWIPLESKIICRTDLWSTHFDFSRSLHPCFTRLIPASPASSLFVRFDSLRPPPRLPTPASTLLHSSLSALPLLARVARFVSPYPFDSLRPLRLFRLFSSRLWVKGIMDATCVVLVFLPRLHKRFPHMHVSEKHHVNR
jgi:hypothetical protein